MKFIKQALFLVAAFAAVLMAAPAQAQFNPSNGFSTINNQCGTFFLQGSTYYNYQGVSIGSSLPVCAGALSTQLGSNVLITGGTITNTTLNTPDYTVATLPTCNAASKGNIVTVLDAASSPVYNATATGGGSIALPVFCNGTNWTNH